MYTPGTERNKRTRKTISKSLIKQTMLHVEEADELILIEYTAIIGVLSSPGRYAKCMLELQTESVITQLPTETTTIRKLIGKK